MTVDKKPESINSRMRTDSGTLPWIPYPSGYPTSLDTIPLGYPSPGTLPPEYPTPEYPTSWKGPEKGPEIISTWYQAPLTPLEGTCYHRYRILS